MKIMPMLSERTVETIKAYTVEKWSEDNLSEEFPNLLLREDVLALLDKYCTVIYYPLESEENNGFHVTGIPDSRGNERHFVFINTAQTIEKQVFTAAHELGHIWKVDETVETRDRVDLTEEMREQIINRFAAELLIPEDEFKKSFGFEVKKNRDANGKITVANMLKVIVALMNQFFAPMKSIVYRCYELKMLTENTTALLLGQGSISQNVIDDKVSEIIRNNGYIEFQSASCKKWIDGLAELLEQAEVSGAISTSKIEKMRTEFSLPQTSKDVQMDGIVDIKTAEGC